MYYNDDYLDEPSLLDDEYEDIEEDFYNKESPLSDMLYEEPFWSWGHEYFYY